MKCTLFICLSMCIQLEQIYKDAHAKIREDPSFTKKAPREDVKRKRFVKITFPGIKLIKTASVC